MSHDILFLAILVIVVIIGSALCSGVEAALLAVNPLRVHELAASIANRIDGRIEKKFDPRDELGTVEYVYYMDQIPLNEGSWTIMARTNKYVSEFISNLLFNFWSTIYFSS